MRTFWAFYTENIIGAIALIKMSLCENMNGFLSSENTNSELSSGDFNSPSPSPSYDSAIESEDMTVLSHIQFEGIFDRTQISKSNITISSVSKVFFDISKNKIHSLQIVEIDETKSISKCTAQVQGAKCELRLDSHFRTVELLGIGFKVWRVERFPKIAQT